MRNLLESWNTVRPRLRAAKAIALFLDSDGMLASLQARPAEVQLPPETRSVPPAAISPPTDARLGNQWATAGGCL
jgi:hypothetical protein